MVVDTSALLAILMNEPERRAFNEKIEASQTRLLSAASFVEASLVLETRVHATGLREFGLFLDRANIEIVSVDIEQAHAACAAFRKYGKGFHPARLNFGDCFAYALAITTGEPLLFKGNDFAQTDVTPA